MWFDLRVKNSILRKILPPERRSVYQVSKEGKLELTPQGSDPSPKDWPPAQKFRLLMEGKIIPPDQRGE